MFILKSEAEFDSAHYLSGYDGKCGSIHGHRYRVIIKISGETLKAAGQSRGMIEDFSVIKSNLKAVCEIFDHKLIIEENEEGKEIADFLKGKHEILFTPYRPTAEEMSRDIYQRLRSKGINVTEVELYETANNSCIYTELRHAYES